MPGGDVAGRVGPYELLEEIGAGAMGRVFRARDPRNDELVAIKTLKADATSEDFYSLKREFRIAGALSSPNLVPIYDLFVNGESAHIVMPLLRGRTIDRWTFERPWRADPAWPMRVLGQILSGLADLHGAGLVHRDVKPRNAMLEPDGRVLLLDYGLATRTVDLDTFVASSGRIAGTFAYMPPEAIFGEPASPARDVFAAGIVMCELIDGRRPPRRPSRWDVQIEPTRERLRAAWPEMPEPLFLLIERMLATDPADRCTVDEALDAVAGMNGALVRRGLPSPPRATVMIGRDEERALVLDALGPRGARVALVGPSGMGKSSLASAVVTHSLAESSTVLVLGGRCHPGEHLRYRVFDAVIDELSRWLARCSAVTVRQILPPELPELVDAFPVLARLDVESLEAAPRDPEERRRRLGAGLAKLFERVERAWPTLVWIDDMQWADPDGVRLLREVLDALGDGGPRWLFAAQALPDALAARCGSVVELGPLDEERARALIDARAAGEPWEDRSDAILAQSSGNPGLLCHLIDHAALSESDAAPTLASLVERRLELLGDTSRDLASALSLVGQPIPQDALSAMGWSDPRRAVHELEAVGLVRRVPYRELNGVEVAHDGLREVIRARIARSAEGRLHRSLATALEAAPSVAREVVAEHWKHAGEPERARAHLLEAARDAREALAFDHAVRCYERALEVTPPAQIGATLPALAEALALAGRGRDAAERYEDAASHAPPDRAQRYLERASIQYLIAGYVDAGLSRVRSLFGALGIRLPRSLLVLLVHLMLRRAWMRWRGWSYRLREEPAQPHADIADAAYAISTTLTNVDPTLAMFVQGLHLSHGLRSGSPLHIARALALEAGFAGASGDSARRSKELLGQARTVMGERDDPRVRALFAINRAGAAWARGRWGECEEAARQAERVARDECVGAWWELSFSRSVLQDSLRWMGRYDDLRELTERYVADALRRGDRFGSVTFRTRFATTLALVDGDLEAAEAACAAGEGWDARGVHLQHLAELHARAERLLYAGQPCEALAFVERRLRDIRHSPLLTLPAPRAKAYHLVASCRLACAVEGAGSHRARLLRGARAATKRARARPWPYMELLADGLGVTARHLAGESVSAELGDLAIRADELSMAAHAEALRLAASVAADDGEARARAAAALASRGVREPARWAATLLPGLLTPGGDR